MIYIDLKPPHGFLIWRGKQTALANDEPLPVNQPLLIISNGEAYGQATLGQPVVLSLTEFERGEMAETHCVSLLERKMWWPEHNSFYVQRINDWQPFKKARLVEIIDGQPLFISDQDELSPAERELLGGIESLPKTITLVEQAVSLSAPGADWVGLDPALNGLAQDGLERVLKAAYPGIEPGQPAGDYLPIYSLALVRQPRLRIERGHKQNGDKKKEVETPSQPVMSKQQEKQMPYNKVETEDGWCVTNEDSGEAVHCYEGDGAEGKADRLLTALRLNVEGEEKQESGEAREQGGDGILAEVFEARVLELIQKALDGRPGEFAGLEKAVTSAKEPDSNLTDPRQTPDSNLTVTPPETDDNLTDTSQKQFDESDWDGAASNWDTAEAYCRDCLIDVNPSGEDKVKDLCFLPYRRPGNDEPNVNALRAIGGGRGITRLERPEDVSAATWNGKLRTAARRLIGWWPEAFEREAPESIFELAGQQRSADKAGSRLRQSMVEKLQAIRDWVGEMLTWAMYEDGQPEPVELDLFNGLTEEMLAEGVGMMSFKAADGTPWHIVWASNGFIDREGEIVSTKALEDFVAANEPREEKGFFNYWHIPGTDFARKEWQAVIGRFLVEAGPYLDDAVGQAFQMFFKQYPDRHPDIAPEGWGASIEFMFLPEERETGVYETVHIDRTSTLPRFAAANIWTQSMQEFTMNDKQRASLETIMGKAGAEAIIALSEKRTEDLEAAGVEHKQAAEPATPAGPQAQPEPTPEAQPEPEAEAQPEPIPAGEISLEEIVNAALTTALAQMTTEVAQPLGEGLNIVATEMKSIAERLATLEQAYNLQKQIELPRFRFNLEDLRGSQAKETSVEEDDELREQQPLSQTDGSMAASYFLQQKQ